MTERGNLTAAIEQTLPDIDRYLADQDIPVTDRPLQAAITFAVNFVEAVQDKGAPAAPLGDLQDFLARRRSTRRGRSGACG